MTLYDGVMFSFFKKKKSAVSSSWWHESLTPEEQIIIGNAFQPLGNISAESIIASANPSAIGSLVGHLKKEAIRHLGYRLLEYADTFISEHVPILSVHFYWAARGEFYYRWRNHDDFALEQAVKSFQRQIGLSENAIRAFTQDKQWGSLPAHAGYRQLRIIEEKRGNLILARNLCEEAKSQGWADNWDHHIARIDKKLAKLKL
ncbi:MAG: hypothetical protein ABJN04_04405 [Hyphomicrobiales bacterium]